MRLPLLLALLLGLALPAAAQRPAGRGGQDAARGTALAGRVVDAATSEPLAAATVALYAERDSSLVTGAITDGEGAFALLGLRPGAFYLRVSFVGYEPQTVAGVRLRAGAREDVGTLRMAPDAEALGEVQVTGERAAVEVRVDRTVYNTEDQPVSAGGSASDVLATLPSVEVDDDGNVSFRGNPNVAVYLDGRPVPVSGSALAALLRGLPAGSVARVEIIPNPSAKFDPEGMGGILNIVMKDTANTPTGGSVTLSGGTGPTGEAQASLSTGVGPVRLFSSYAFRYGASGFTRETIETPRDGSFALDQIGGGERAGTSHTVSTQADWTVRPGTRLGLSALVNVGQDEDAGDTRYAFDPATGSTVTAVGVTTEDESDWTTDLALTFGRDFAEAHALTAEARYSHNADEELSTVQQSPLETTAGGFDIAPLDFRDAVDEATDEAYGQFDYVRPLAGFNLEAGYKGTYRRIGNAFARDTLAGAVYVPALGLSNRFVYDETTHAGYALLTRALGLLELQGGLRVERTDYAGDLQTPVPADDQSFERGRTDLFPSAAALYKLSEAHRLTAQYSRRIERPSTRALNPFSAQDDPLFRREGNPDLTPEYTDAFELGYAYVTGPLSVQLQPYYRRTTDVIRRDIRRDPVTNVRTLTFENFASASSYGVESTVSFQLGRVRGFVSANAFRESTDGGNVESDLSSEAVGVTMRGNLTVQVTSSADLQAQGFYRSPQDIPRGRIESFQSVDLALRQKLGDRASLTLRASDPFNQRQFQFRIVQDDLVREGLRKRDSQRFVVALTYQFGQQDRRQRRDERGERGGDVEGDM